MIRAASNRYKCALLLLDYPLHVDNELMHTVPHRESYREMYTSPARLGCPNFAWPRVFPLAFGESFTFEVAIGQSDLSHGVKMSLSSK